MKKQKFIYSVIGLCFVTGCTTPRVVYTPITTALTKDNADEAGTLIRIPRSIIKIVTDESIPTDFISTAIDPIDSKNKQWLPLNEGKYAYTLDVVHDSSGTISAKDFASISNNLIYDDLSSFPFPSCDHVTLKIYSTTKANIKIKVSAIPTELAVPTSPGAAVFSPVYKATAEDDLFSTTTLKVTYLDDSLISKTVATETQDNVKDEIKTVASIIGTVVTAAAAPSPGASAPNDAKEEIAIFTFATANNQDYLLIPLPTKGTISAHSSCGADVTDTSAIKSSVQNDLDVLQTAISEGISLYKKTKEKK